MFTAILDIQVVASSLTAIGDALDLSDSQLGWIRSIAVRKSRLHANRAPRMGASVNSDSAAGPEKQGLSAAQGRGTLSARH
jgi:hypothetical protein